MTEEEANNARRVAEIFGAFGQGNVPAILDQLTDDVCFVSHLDPVVPWAGEFSGKDEVARFFHALGGAVEVMGHPVNSVIAEGDTVIATGSVSFRVRETDSEASSSWVYIFTFANDRVRRYEQFNDANLAAAFR